jgi:ankyrin repeat protein
MNNDELFINAITENNVSLVASLIADGSANVNARVAEMQNGFVLHLAANRGLVELVATLLNAGAHIDNVNDFDDSACHVAVRQGHTDVVSLLVARNANLSLQNGAEQTPITIAINKKNEALLMLCIDAAMRAGAPPDDATMCLAATVGTDVIQLLVHKHRINLDAIRDNNGHTPLHRAVHQKSDASVLDTLVKVARIDVNARAKNGFTAAHTACTVRNADALTFLIAAGANLDLGDNRGNTPLHFTQFDPTDQMAVLLLAAGVDVNAKNESGRTACNNTNVRWLTSLPVLMAFGANLDEPDNGGVTARQRFATGEPPTSEQIELARQRVLSVQFSFVRQRAFEICIALQSQGLDALCLCEILLHSCTQVAPFVPFHRWWQIVTKIKHFHRQSIAN